MRFAGYFAGAVLALACASRTAEARQTPDDSLAVYGALLIQAQIADDSSGIAEASYRLGLAHWSLDRYDSALVHLLRTRDIRQVLGDRAGLASALNSLGATHYQAGNYGPALEAFLASLAIRRAENDLRGTAVNLANIGKTYQDWRQFERAIPVLEEAVEHAVRSGDRAVLGYSLHSLGAARVDLGELDEARKLFERSLEAYRALNQRRTPSDSAAGWSLNALSLARLDIREGRPAEALVTLEAVLGVAERNASVREQADVLNAMGAAYLRLGQPTNALGSYRGAYALAAGVQQRSIELAALEGMARAEEALGDVRGALAHLRAARALQDTIFNQGTAQRIAAMELEAQSEREREANAALALSAQAATASLQRQRQVTGLSVATGSLGALLALVLLWAWQSGRRREREVEAANAELRAALAEVSTLSGFIPICAHCKRVRDDDGYWKAVETYISSRSDAQFSHAICSNCGPELYGADWTPSEATAPARQA